MTERNDPADQDFFPADVFDDPAFKSLGPNLTFLKEHAIVIVNLVLNDLDPTSKISRLQESRRLCEEAGISRDLVLLTERRVEDGLIKGAKAKVMQLEGHVYRLRHDYGLAARARVEKSTP